MCNFFYKSLQKYTARVIYFQLNFIQYNILYKRLIFDIDYLRKLSLFFNFYKY